MLNFIFITLVSGLITFISFLLQICAKQAYRKREAFDMTSSRIEGTMAEPYKDLIVDVEKRKVNWRVVHQHMLQALREAKREARPTSDPERTVEILIPKHSSR